METEQTIGAAAPEVKQTALVRRSMFDQVREIAEYMADLDAVANALCKSTILPKEMQHPANLKLVLAQGLSMGFDVWQSIRASFIIPAKREGDVPKVGYYSDAKVALVRTKKVCRFFRVEESTAKKCRVVCARTDEPEDMIHVFELTIEQARESGLDKKWWFDRGRGEWVSEVKPNWQTNPADMLNARVCGRACNRVFQDVVYGMQSPEDIEDIATAEASMQPFVSVQTMPSTAPAANSTRAAGAAPPASEPVEAELVDDKAEDTSSGDAAWDELMHAFAQFRSSKNGIQDTSALQWVPDEARTWWDERVAVSADRKELNLLGPLIGEANKRVGKSKACGELAAHMAKTFNERMSQLRNSAKQTGAAS